MKFSFDDLTITKDSILDIVSEEEIFEYYLEEEVSLSRRYRNPLRYDENPGCYFSYSVQGTLYLYDKSLNQNYNAFWFVSKLLKLNYYQTLQRIRKDLIITPNRKIYKRDRVKINKKVENRNIRIKRKDFSEKELSFWNIGGLDVTQKDLEDQGIYSVETYWEGNYSIDNCKMVFAYIDVGKVIQLYFPQNKELGKRRFSIGERFFGGYNNLTNDEEFCVIVPKRKCAFYLTYFGIPNMYSLIEKHLISDKLFSILKERYKNIYFLADNDRHGKSAAWAYRSKFGINPIFVPEGKDFTEYLEIAGKESVSEYINHLKFIYNDER